jgi:P pilus assembly chaperone PapD
MKHAGRTISLALVVAAVVFAPGAAQTPGGNGLSGLGINVSPAKFEISMSPGMNYNIPVLVQNSSSDTTHIQASMVDFGVTQSGSYQFSKPGSMPYSVMRWATINPREFDLPAGTSQQVRVSLAIPKETALSGEYAGIVFFQTRPTRKPHAVSFSVRIATKIYLTIPGTVKIAGAVQKMTATKGSGSETYRVLFKNTGNAHVYLNGSLEVRRGGSTVEKIALPKNDLVERGQDRLIEISGKALPPGKYQAVALVDYGGTTMTGGEIEFDNKP